MPTRHSKNCGDKHHFTHAEKVKAGLGSLKQKIGSESQLPFGHCCLSMHPAEDAVVSPSGHLYSREAILEYLLLKNKEIKQTQRLFEEQQRRLHSSAGEEAALAEEQAVRDFTQSQDGVADIAGKRKVEAIDPRHQELIKKKIDHTDKAIKLAALQKMSPWLPLYTPSAAPAAIKEPPKRPLSPFSGRPIRTKDLIPVTLTKENETDGGAKQHFICPVSRKTITTQKVVLLRNTGILMLEDTAKQLAYPTMTCPMTGKSFKQEDILHLSKAASGFSASGKTESKVFRPNGVN